MANATAERLREYARAIDQGRQPNILVVDLETSQVMTGLDQMLLKDVIFALWDVAHGLRQRMQHQIGMERIATEAATPGRHGGN